METKKVINVRYRVHLPMTLQYCSDLHLEFQDNSKRLRKKPIIAKGEVLILAGDIVPFTEIEDFKDFFDFVADNFQAAYWIPGNHEYYGSDITERSSSFREAIRSNVFLLNNQVEQINGMSFIFSTLWSAISPAAEWEIARALADYRMIRWGNELFRPLHNNYLHKECRQFIEEAVSAAGSSKIVVTTHHVPTFMHYPSKYRGAIINEAFATELHDFIEQSNIDSWIFGHHHFNKPEFKIGNTRMLTNQLGYVKQGEFIGYREAAVISISRSS